MLASVFECWCCLPALTLPCTSMMNVAEHVHEHMSVDELDT